MIISIHQNNLLNPSDIYESYNTVIADEFNVPYFFATNITRKLKIVMKKIELCMSCCIFIINFFFCRITKRSWTNWLRQVFCDFFITSITLWRVFGQPLFHLLQMISLWPSLSQVRNFSVQNDEQTFIHSAILIIQIIGNVVCNNLTAWLLFSQGFDRFHSILNSFMIIDIEIMFKLPAITRMCFSYIYD